MPRIINARQTVNHKKGRGIDGNRLSMCHTDCVDEKNEMPSADKEQMSEIISKLSKIKIINPKNGARAKSEIKNKYITI